MKKQDLNRNLTRLVIAYQELLNFPLPNRKIGVVYGFPGCGKSSAAIWLSDRVKGLFV